MNSPLQVRRCEILLLEPRESIGFELASLLAGGDGISRRMAWLALAPHLDQPVEVTPAQREVLGKVSPSRWIPISDVEGAPEVVGELLASGLLVARDSAHDAHRERDESIRAAHWHPLGAAIHAFTRWDGVDAIRSMKESGIETAAEMRQVLGPPPPEADIRRPGEAAVRVLPRTPDSAFDDLLHRRATCRNFDPARKVPLPIFSKILERSLAAQGHVRVTEDLVFVKKNVPSGGGLHPMEAYVIVQHVEGLAAGLYHYRSDTHALEPLAAPDTCLADFVIDAVARQHWFGDAHALVVLAPRYDRTFWKYRHHAKGYRVVAMEAGHISQTLYLAATDLGLGAFVTGAVNEKTLERALGLDVTRQGVLAICGFGWRAQAMIHAELDPLNKIWA